MSSTKVKWLSGLLIAIFWWWVLVFNPFWHYQQILKNNPTATMYNQEPLFIHQIWLGPRHPPIQLMEDWNFEYTKKCPNSKYIYWSDMKHSAKINKNEWDIRNISELMQMFASNSTLFHDIYRIYNSEIEYYGKSDIVRLFILFLYGGIYIDTDSAWVNNKCLNNLFNQLHPDTTIFTALEPGRTHPANGVIGVNQKYDPLIEYLMTFLQRNYYELRIPQNKTHVWEITGPGLWNRIKHKITVFPEEYFYPISWHNLTNIRLNEANGSLHKQLNYSNNTYMFQYGFSTNERGYGNKVQWRRRRRRRRIITSSI